MPSQPFNVSLLSSRNIKLDGTMTIKVGFDYTPRSTTQPDFRDIFNKLANPVLASQVDHAGIVTIVICGAKNLSDRPTGDLFVPSNTPSLLTRSQVTRIGWDMDLYVKVTVGDEHQLTRFIQHDRNPVWDEQLVFHVRERDLSRPILLSVFGRDRFSDDRVGDTSIEFSDLTTPASGEARTTDFFSDNLSTMSEFDKPLVNLNPKRSYKDPPTLTFR